ncbi:hypothetical protein AALP_AA6G251000 [Arabis alpina]|uniref:Uncharacterized protein n=1 Tax=Arabis alpina TaxID=50452 RepID=A0A087GRK0_ARAAL|nr:hypothetical protein AALP_AA6G251000 [Arabis alpina]
MASMPLYWEPPPQQHTDSGSASDHSTIGPFIAVFIVITVLCVLASVIGRLCSGKTILGYGDYDMERWAESRCASCIDGHILPHRRPSPERHVADPNETHGEKQDSLDHEPPPQTSSSAHSS